MGYPSLFQIRVWSMVSLSKLCVGYNRCRTKAYRETNRLTMVSGHNDFSEVNHGLSKYTTCSKSGKKIRGRVRLSIITIIAGRTQKIFQTNLDP